MNKEKRQRFQNAVDQTKQENCIDCPCENGCYKLSEEDLTPCETILFIYVETGETENFEKYLTK